MNLKVRGAWKRATSNLALRLMCILNAIEECVKSAFSWEDGRQVADSS